MGLFITRTDGSRVRFHTTYSTNKVDAADLSEPPGLPGPPKHGKGRSDGRGTYRPKATGNYTTNSRSAQGTHGGGGVADAAQGDVVGGGGADAAPNPHGGSCMVVLCIGGLRLPHAGSAVKFAHTWNPPDLDLGHV